MLKRVAGLTLCAMALGPAAWADGVVSDVGECGGYYALSSPDGYVVVEWVSGAPLLKGDAVGGDLTSIGAKEVTLSNNGKAQIFVDSYGMNQAAATKAVEARCVSHPFFFP